MADNEEPATPTTSIEATPEGVTVEETTAVSHERRPPVEEQEETPHQIRSDPLRMTNSPVAPHNLPVPALQQSNSNNADSSSSDKQQQHPEQARKSKDNEEEESSLDGSSAGGDSDDDDDDSAVQASKGGGGVGGHHHLRHTVRESVKVQEDMKMVRNVMKDSYRCEGNKVLLHGYLHIQIIRAKGLRNLDCFRGFNEYVPSAVFLCCAQNVSDPYVTVHAGKSRLIKTSTIFDDLNPVWNTDYYMPISHPIEHLEFRVKDWDEISNELIGRAYLPVSDLIRFGGVNGKPQRTGVHRVVYLDGNVRNGAFEFHVEFIPKDMMHHGDVIFNPTKSLAPVADNNYNNPMVVPGVYFQPRQQNNIRLYINADDKSKELGTPDVKYGDNLKKKWKPQRLWRDIYVSLCEAKHLIYIVGWSVDYRQSLLRGEEARTGLISPKRSSRTNSFYSSYIGELLKQKADEGVIVNLLVWDDQTSTRLNDGAVGTRDEQLRNYFYKSRVNLRLVPMVGGKAHVFKQVRQSVYYTHHQKCVICDTEQKELMAYVGGVDLTYGRYDDGSYPLFRTLKSVHLEDFHSACFDVNPRLGPREPWHDIHNRVEGPVVMDLIQNFEERWVGQGGSLSELVDLEKKGLKATVSRLKEDDKEAWNTQLFRSIDSRTANLSPTEGKPIPFDEIKDVQFDGEGKELDSGKRQKMYEKLLKTGKEYERSYIADTMDSFDFVRNVHLKREVQIDDSVHKGLVHHIRNAQHTLYIESQYFLGSSFLWEDYKTQKCSNLIASEITWKICDKIEAGERFAAYIVIPMWPEGFPDSGSVQDILFFQYQTIQSMYKRVSASIQRRKERLKATGNDLGDLADATPTDYLNFYCLASRETEEHGDDIDLSDNNVAGAVTLLNRTRRHLVYCHSKMTIVDDAIAIIGSANINQRSLDGNRDSELLLGAWQPAYLASKERVAQGEVHAFRMHCWAHLTGVMEDCFRDPSSLASVHRVNEIAEHNWGLYTQEEPCDMKSFLVPYPINILEGGKIVAKTANGKFPDTTANILGSKPSLPEYLTT